jgi:hypothetical protein
MTLLKFMQRGALHESLTCNNFRMRRLPRLAATNVCIRRRMLMVYVAPQVQKALVEMARSELASIKTAIPDQSATIRDASIAARQDAKDRTKLPAV